MARQSFNEGWVCRPPISAFEALMPAAGEPVPVTLPHDALRDTERSAESATGGAQAYYQRGAFAYVRDLDVPADWVGKQVVLEVQGAYRHAQVFVNDALAGNRANGYARFLVDLTPYLRFGETNHLAIGTRNGLDSRWYSGAGLHRSLVLHVNPPVHIAVDGVRVTTLDVEDDQAVIEVATTVANAGPTTVTARVSTTIADPSGAQVEADETPVTVVPGGTALVRQRLYLADPQLWSADEPNLYTATSGLGDDETRLETRFGVRTLQVDPKKGLRVNGQMVFLRGACLHHDNGPLGAAAIPRAEERRIELLKAAGFNAIRTAHNPASPAMLEACDRVGMYVMDEAFDMWWRGKSADDYALQFPQWFEDDLAAMVAKDYNHPSVIMYSLGNEIIEVGTPHGSALTRRMAECVRSHDSTRIVTNGVNAMLAVIDELAAAMKEAGGLNEMLSGDLDDSMNQASLGENVTLRTEESSSVLDVLGLNYAEGRYAIDKERFPHRVLVGSETFPSKIGMLWPMIIENAHVIGDFTWTGWDYLGEVGIGAVTYAEDEGAREALEREFPWLTAWCGDIDITGHRRPVSYYREVVFGLRTEPYIAVRRPERHGQTVAMASPWAWSDSVGSWTWPGFEGKPVTVEVYANADEVRLLLDNDEIGRADVGDEKPRLAVIETTYHAGELMAVAIRDGKEVGRTSLVTAVGDVALKISVDRAEISASPDDLAYVALELVDEQGELFTSEDRPVTVEVSGAGVLAGMCSANPATTERFADATWRTFDGRALAVIRPTGPGEITVTATAEALAPQTLTLTAR